MSEKYDPRQASQLAVEGNAQEEQSCVVPIFCSGCLLLCACWEGHFKHPLLPTTVEAENLITPPNPVTLAPFPEVSLRLQSKDR